MDERNLASESGVEPRAISYTKGCYIGQEVISRIRSVGQVTRSLRGLEFDSSDLPPPRTGDPLSHGGREVGYVTSAVRSPGFARTIGLGYVRREVTDPGIALAVRTEAGSVAAHLLKLPLLDDPVSQFERINRSTPPAER
jgi:aminomethyltransferase